MPEPAATNRRNAPKDTEELLGGSVWLTGQRPSRDQRRGRYLPASMSHPAKMLPAIAEWAIRTYTDPGDYVLDPMGGIGTTVVEAMHAGRHGVAVEYEPRWAHLAAGNIRRAATQGATGTGWVYQGDARRLRSVVPARFHGRISLVITSPPYGPSTHGHVREGGARHGKILKLDHRYGTDRDNLAYLHPDDLAAGLTEILAGCAAALRPGGHILVTARPYRRGRELVDIPGMVLAAGTAAELTAVDRLIALIAGVRDGRLIPRASFFQLRNLRVARAAGDSQWLVTHEDLIVLEQTNQPSTTAANNSDRLTGAG
jgi:hypothetical protein